VREWLEDPPLLVEHSRRRFHAGNGLDIEGLSDTALGWLAAPMDW
jgi:hypothetical protein